MKGEEKILLPNQPEAKQETEFKGAVIFQDDNYVIIRKTPTVNFNEATDIPFQIGLIGLYAMLAQTMVPHIGRDQFLKKVKLFTRAVRKHTRMQIAISSSIKNIGGEKGNGA